MLNIKCFFIILFSPLYLFSTLHEDAEDNKTSRWQIFQNTSSSIENLYDSEKLSRTIVFKGKGTQTAYGLSLKDTKPHEYWLQWDMKFTEDFTIMVVLDTNRGRQLLIYTPGISQSYKQYGIGSEALSNRWQTYKRNVQEDLAYFDNRVKVLGIKRFVVRGSGSIDNVYTSTKQMKSQKIIKKAVIKEKKIKHFTNSLPVLEMKGKAHLSLKLGETYVEAGVSAYDKEDGELFVESVDNIDIFANGRYTVMYMATDSDGNIATNQRIVQVGIVEEEKEVSDLNEEIVDTSSDEEVQQEENSNYAEDLAEQQHQIEIWERELESRERKLREREKNSNLINKKN